MRKQILRVTAVTFTLTSVNRAMIRATGEVPTAGWSDPQLDGPRLGDGILHLSFVAEPPGNKNVTQVITSISAEHSVQLGSQPQDVTVHAQSNEMSLRLPAADDAV